jgi:hypothetical protein
MQKPFAYSPVNKDAPDSFFSRRQFPIIAFIAAIMALIISFPLINARYGGNDSAVHSGASTADELFSGMPLP